MHVKIDQDAAIRYHILCKCILDLTKREFKTRYTNHKQSINNAKKLYLHVGNEKRS